MLRLLVDTSTRLDLAKRRDGQKLIGALRELYRTESVRLLVPAVVIDEFKRNRPRIVASMTASVAERFRQIRRDVNDFGGDEYGDALELIDGLAHEMPLIGAMTTRNFDDILTLISAGEILDASPEERARVVDRGLNKLAPFHRSKNSVADALIIELHASRVSAADEAPYVFVTSNSDDFWLPNGDERLPHPDLRHLFEPPRSTYRLGVAGLESALRDQLGDELDALMDEFDFQEDPRRLDEILQAEQEYFDRVWYHRSLMHEYRIEDEDGPEGLAELLKVAGPGRGRIEATYTEPGQLGPYTDFELGPPAIANRAQQAHDREHQDWRVVMFHSRGEQPEPRAGG
jgi:hypothetical protein